MGFTKWLFKNGIGSIGSTAKTWTKVYLDTTSEESDSRTKESAFFHVSRLYTMANQSVRQYFCSDPAVLIDKSEDCLAMFIWSLICEIPTNVNALLSEEKTFNTANEVVYQCVMELAANEIRMTPAIFKDKSLDYLEYKLNVAKVLEANHNIQETKFRTAIIDKQTRMSDVTEDLFLIDAKSRFLRFANNNNQDRFIVWTIEMNSNKYVYVHYCTEKNFKDNFNEGIKYNKGIVRFDGIDD